MCSMPTESLTQPGVTPAFNRSTTDSYKWVVEAGWIVSVRASSL
jgi:hypothetical protein